jgi:hypothetical protein
LKEFFIYFISFYLPSISFAFSVAVYPGLGEHTEHGDGTLQCDVTLPAFICILALGSSAF